MPSNEYSPSDWACPTCHARHAPDLPLTFFRGTCCHDVCRPCIAAAVHRRNLVPNRTLAQRAATRKREENLAEVPCPLGKCWGKFVVDGATFKNPSGGADEVIDLCDEEEQKQPGHADEVKVKNEKKGQEHNSDGAKREVKREDEQSPTGRAKREIKREGERLPTGRRSNPIKEEKRTMKSEPVRSSPQPASPTHAHNNIVSPLPVKKRSHLKPLFEIGDPVCAAWWDLASDPAREGDAAWYPGTIRSYRVDGSSRYGPTRAYRVEYDDGDELDGVADCWVMAQRDYRLTMQFEGMGWEWIGVEHRYDRESTDRWARDVGWYAVTVDGTEQRFSLLADAMKAHDACVVRTHGEQTKRSYLNLPEDYAWLFAEETSASTFEGARASNAVSPATSKETRESNNSDGRSGDDGGSGKEDSDYEDESDGESRFSEVDESVDGSSDGNYDDDGSSSEDDDEGGEWRAVKRRRLDLSLEANAQNTEFWSVDRKDIQFTRQAFLAKSIFHLNSFVDGKKKKNQAFSLFIREGVATPGFNPVPTSIDIDKIASMTYCELRNALTAVDGEWGASQTALWLKRAAVGSFVIMRHEYPKCRFTPKRLRDSRGKYIGPVYVIGIITKKVVPWSAEETHLAEKKMGEFHKIHWCIHNLCRVSWKRMGYKKDLTESTQSYINHVCQPTLQHILSDPAKEHRGATMEAIREDLWANASIPIRSDEFSDKFDHHLNPGESVAS